MDLAFQLYEFIALLMISVAVAIVVKYVRLPYTIALVVVGLLVGLANIFPEIKLSEDLIFLLILPPLLFEGALNTDLGELRSNFKPILCLAIVGVLVSVVVTGFLVRWLLSIPLSIALLFGAMITPTDPVSVLATFRELKAPKRLSTIIEGESILNDGTGVVIFGLILEMVRTGHFSLVSGMVEFGFVTVGGIVVGFSFGYTAYRILRYIDDHLIEITITIILAYSTYLFAESVHVSGVIAVVTAGLIIGNYGRLFSMSPSTRIALTDFWALFVFIVNSIVFLLIGIDVSGEKIFVYSMETLLAIPVVIAGRALAVYPLLTLTDKISERIPARWKHIVFWGGLHGTIPVALALSLSDIPHRDMIASMTFGVVLFSLIVQGLSLEYIVKRIFRREESIYEEHIARRIALKRSIMEIERMRRDGEITGNVAEKIISEIKVELEEISSKLLEIDVAERDLLLKARKRILHIQKSVIRDLAIRGTIGEDVVRKLTKEIDSELDALE
ncbi:sodium/proton antiporter, CPA1 family [Archaeoglobus sulfaticallidus PM70-1]|uniref:Sodium/proton antiporter, CPA1 family n=1 Tax=Archaeoglobus sulfaticallidus PM70-1 TaxID=387631 RepID=N0BNM4_9EURY|nr:Na+/H+ antiporter [Archaeoglobus sulfaticallidus]AGK61925.1 sodium/proton antiporter, CPA1 family [Archaeoglobus sulfaticallidus PM70-1]